MTVKITTVNNGIEVYLDGLTARENGLQSFLNNYVYKFYQNKQRERWMTENASEGTRWNQLSDTYATWKKKKYASYPGGGTKMLIATGKLFAAVIGPGQGQKKIVINNQLYISIMVEGEKKAVNYAGYVNDARNFFGWSQSTVNQIERMVADFVFKANIKQI